MIRRYEDKRIYRNLKIVFSIGIVSFTAILMIFIYVLVMRYGYGLPLSHILFVNKIEEERVLLLFFFLLIVPFDIFVLARWMLKREPNQMQEKKLDNDFVNTVTFIVLQYISPLLVIFTFSINCFNLMIELHIPLYVGGGFLIQNCFLIKREWKNSQPAYILETQARQEQCKREKMVRQQMQQYQPLIEKCGIKFFIEYYRQIVRLPLRDVTITENYSSQEREERLTAAKKIIGLGLSEFALTDIIDRYGDILEIAEVEQAKALLADIQQATSQS